GTRGASLRTGDRLISPGRPSNVAFYRLARRSAVVLKQLSDAQTLVTGPSHKGEPEQQPARSHVDEAVAAPARMELPSPPEAAAAGIQRPVVVEIVINERGEVADARIVQSVPVLDEAALAAVRQWQSTPAVINRQ